MFRFIILFFLIFGCSTCTKTLTTKSIVYQSMNRVYIDPEIKPYVKSYLDVMIMRNVDVFGISNLDSIIFVPNDAIICDSGDAIGCSWNGTIKIKKNWRYYLSTENYLKVMMYHELGHAILKLPHANFSYHIMFPSINVDTDVYEINWKYYLDTYVAYYQYCNEYDYLLK